jgi:hypothetical protein
LECAEWGQSTLWHHLSPHLIKEKEKITAGIIMQMLNKAGSRDKRKYTLPPGKP